MQAMTPKLDTGKRRRHFRLLSGCAAQQTRLRASQAALTVNSHKRAGLVAMDSSNGVAVPDRFGREIFPHQPNRSQ
jgi:hypothetical protein